MLRAAAPRTTRWSFSSSADTAEAPFKTWMMMCCPFKTPRSSTFSSENLAVPTPGVSVKSIPKRSATWGLLVSSVRMLTRATSAP